MKFFTTIFLLLYFITITGQEFSKEIGIISENDAYMMQGNDGYYTNGLEIYTNWKAKDSLRIHSFSVGQRMYNAQNITPI